ncbi:MAG: dihydroneopterin aldolase [Bacteroidaceae bacterium]|nr:dihydroneopterin aldolase [Bacteroidaceae bacterium]
MLCNIHIRGLRLAAKHGVLEQERLIGADFVVSIDAEVEVDDKAFAADDIDGTVSYADVVETVKIQMSVTSNLLEHVAYRIASSLLDRFRRIRSVCVCIDKENPPCGVTAFAIGVEIRLHR